MSERMTDDMWHAGQHSLTRAQMHAEGSRARASEVEKDATIKALADYIRLHAGHEEHCRGWRQPVKDKTAPSWKRRGEWMDLSRCTCGPGELLRLAGRLP